MCLVMDCIVVQIDKDNLIDLIGDEMLMEILLYVSAIIAALSLLLIAVFVVITLKSAKQTMGEVSETLKRVETKLGGITENLSN